MKNITQKHFPACKNKTICFIFFIIFIFQFFISCTEIEMIDRSSDPKYSPVIGKKLILKKDILLLGISSENKLPADYFVLVPGVGFSGPEVVSRSTMQNGTVLQIFKVLVAKSLISSKSAFAVKEIKGSRNNGKEIRITLIGDVISPTYGLDKKYYKILN